MPTVCQTIYTPFSASSPRSPLGFGDHFTITRFESAGRDIFLLKFSRLSGLLQGKSKIQVAIGEIRIQFER